MGEEGVRRVLPDEAVGHRVVGVRAAVDLLDVHRPGLVVQVLDDALQEPLEVVRIERLVVLLPPDAVLQLGPGDAERVLDGTTRAGRVGVVDERAVDPELRRDRLRLVVRAVRADASAIVRERFAEELFLREVVLVLDRIESEELLEGGGVVHGARRG